MTIKPNYEHRYNRMFRNIRLAGFPVLYALYKSVRRIISLIHKCFLCKRKINNEFDKTEKVLINNVPYSYPALFSFHLSFPEQFFCLQTSVWMSRCLRVEANGVCLHSTASLFCFESACLLSLLLAVSECVSVVVAQSFEQ